jgi:hypothetical protein
MHSSHVNPLDCFSLSALCHTCYLFHFIFEFNLKSPLSFTGQSVLMHFFMYLIVSLHSLTLPGHLCLSQICVLCLGWFNIAWDGVLTLGWCSHLASYIPSAASMVPNGSAKATTQELLV